MPLTKRNFLYLAANAFALSPFLGARARQQPPKRVLVIGGTFYLGPSIVEALRQAGHTVTLFNRGITNPELFPDVEKLRGDREPGREDLSALLVARNWDVVIDVWPADPRIVRSTVELLKDRTSRYVFVSSSGVYRDKTVVGITENSPLWDVQTYTPEMRYREAKVICENIVREAFPTNHIIIRPSAIIGWRDVSWSFVYWLWRLRSGGDVLAPGNGDDYIQWTDVKDVGEFIVHTINAELSGIFNTIGPQAEPLLFREFLDRANKHFGKMANLVWVDQAFIEEQQLRPIIDIPMWEPNSRRTGKHQMSSRKAIDAGMQFRHMEATFDDTLNWYDIFESPTTDPATDNSRPFNGITRARELELLGQWRRRQ